MALADDSTQPQQYIYQALWGLEPSIFPAAKRVSDNFEDKLSKGVFTTPSEP